MNPEPSPSLPPSIRPNSVQVFGILHLIFAAFGLLGAVIGIPCILFMEPIFEAIVKIVADADPQVSEVLTVVSESYLSQRMFWLISSLLSLVGTILLLRAGLALIKSKKNGLKLSNIWCYFAIAYTILSLPVTFMVSLPAQKKMEQRIEELKPGATTSAPALDEDIENLINIGATAVGGVLALLYPGLCLGFLNRQKVKDYFLVQE